MTTLLLVLGILCGIVFPRPTAAVCLVLLTYHFLG